MRKEAMRPSILDSLRFKRATHLVESSAAMQLVCPYCQSIQTNCVVDFFPDEIHVCHDTYTGNGCKRRFIGPGPARVKR